MSMSTPPPEIDMGEVEYGYIPAGDEGSDIAKELYKADGVAYETASGVAVVGRKYSLFGKMTGDVRKDVIIRSTNIRVEGEAIANGDVKVDGTDGTLYVRP